MDNSLEFTGGSFGPISIDNIFTESELTGYKKL